MQIKKQSELSFLLELLLNHELKPDTKHLIAERIEVVEESLSERYSSTPSPTPMQVNHYVAPPTIPKQSPSTLALMAKHGDIPMDAMPMKPVMPPPPPVEVIAQTPATAAAIAHRAELLAGAGKNEKGRTSPRKF